MPLIPPTITPVAAPAVSTVKPIPATVAAAMIPTFFQSTFFTNSMAPALMRV
ncbi:MAG: hypothetical protein ACK5LM_00080 [Lactovum sp.]